MYYPLNLTLANHPVYPLFGDQLTGEPHIFDFSSENPKVHNLDTENFENFQRSVFEELEDNGKTWGIGRYLEERGTLLRNYPRIVDEGRIYHLGLDIIAEEDSILYCPLPAVVKLTGIEEGTGNYGGYAVLHHNIGGTVFYSFYGHLNSNHMISEGQKLDSGDVIGRLGFKNDSGGWFTHTHLQILTERAFNENLTFKGYIDKNRLTEIEELFPSPYFLFRQP